MIDALSFLCACLVFLRMVAGGIYPTLFAYRSSRCLSLAGSSQDRQENDGMALSALMCQSRPSHIGIIG